MLKRIKNKKKYLIFGIVIFVTGLLFEPTAVKAATTIYLDLESAAVSAGDTFIVKVILSSPDKSINVIDGTLTYNNEKLEIREISAGGSLFTLWPQPPVFSNEKGKLSFVGGAPNGFQGEEGEVLKIIFFAKSEGEARIDFLDSFSVFLNDGQGTLLNPWLRPLSLLISKKPPGIPTKDEWQVLLESDTSPPEFFEITVGKDPGIFGNQAFISFFTADTESGIDHYEIQEGEEPFRVENSPYLLKDQKLRSPIRVKAIDKAGNERVAELAPTYPPRAFYQTIWFWVAFITVIIILIFIKNKIQEKNV